MDWIETEADQALSDEWESVLDDVASSVSWLREQFSTNDTCSVIDATKSLVADDAGVHSMAGVLHLVWSPVIDVATDANLSSRWSEADDAFSDEDDDTDWSQRQSSVSVTFAAVAECARRSCDVADSMVCSVRGSVEGDGRPSHHAIAEMSAALHRLVEWSRIYLESAIGSYRTCGHLPNTDMAGGSLVDLSEWEQIEDL